MANEEGYRDALAKGRHLKRYADRSKARTQDEINYYGARDHGAYAESMVREMPVLGAAFQLGAIPAYNALKALGVLEGEGSSEGSLGAMAEAYRGVGRGVRDNIGDALHWFTGEADPIAQPRVYPPDTQGMSEEALRAMVLRSYPKKRPLPQRASTR